MNTLLNEQPQNLVVDFLFFYVEKLAGGVHGAQGVSVFVLLYQESK
jgi:hypothetical protein